MDRDEGCIIGTIYIEQCLMSTVLKRRKITNKVAGNSPFFRLLLENAKKKQRSKKNGALWVVDRDECCIGPSDKFHTCLTVCCADPVVHFLLLKSSMHKQGLVEVEPD